jgi:hypothetical protein
MEHRRMICYHHGRKLTSLLALRQGRRRRWLSEIGELAAADAVICNGGGRESGKRRCYSS